MTPGDILVHLRLPFSFFLLPVWLLGVLVAGQGLDTTAVLSGIALHLFLYPASNAFNSYWDRDEGPIGGILNPPKVDRKLLIASIAWELPGLVLLFLAGLAPGLLGLVYSLCSKAYSWDGLRWKRFPRFSLLGIAIVQGSLVVLLCNPQVLGAAAGAANATTGGASPQFLAAALTSAVFLAAVYPLTQIYQHEADAARGDKTFSMLVGIRGTFIHSAACFLLAGAGLAWMLFALDPVEAPLRLALLLACLAPALGYFLRWAALAWKDSGAADFRRTMLMNLLASVGMNLFLIICLVQQSAA